MKYAGDKSREHRVGPVATNQALSEKIDDTAMNAGDFSPTNYVEQNTFEAHADYAVGFANQGNTCWLNASLHILLSLPVFQDLEKISLTRNIEVLALFKAFIKIQKSFNESDPTKKINENIK